MSRLDDAILLREGDPGGMLDAAEGTAEQWVEAVARAQSAEGLPAADDIDGVVVCGMGGSGIAGDVLAAAAAPRLPVPVTVVKGYEMPASVGRRTLVFACSYSGNTEETLACFDEARERGARIVCVTTGGTLAAQAADAGAPVIEPVAGLQPRAALASLAAPLIVICERLGLLPETSGTLKEAEEVLRAAVEQYRREVPAAGNPAKDLANRLEGFLPVVWGQEGPLSVAAIRWRCQLNENAKIPAFSSVLPELDHNELVGYDPGLPTLTQVAVVVLRNPGEHPRIVKRIDATLAAMRERVGATFQVRTPGESPLARLLASAALGDFTAIYLALLRGVDPSPVAVIERLKRELAR